MSILEWPKEVIPTQENWQLLSNSKTFTSPFNGSSQTVRFPGSRWRCELTFNNLNEEKSRQLEALVASLDGMSGRVKIASWIRKGRYGYGSPRIVIPSQLGHRLETKDWKRNMRVLQQGDRLTVGNELKMVVADVVSDNQGYASIPISPMLRTSPTVNEMLEVERPFGIFRLVDNEQGKFQHRRLGYTNITLSFEEVLY
ncbi:TPA: hypothetical protein ACKRES_003403 [Proteus mirabilis]|uniref:hypothetical protein n=1 Tax=Proteus mirabilis TaxID=584 RepID=UPI0018C6726E|nr:hypothetical protein [Proteus mirabilis]MBG2811983.1 hypothetical protein [Proteus mirabilis]